MIIRTKKEERAINDFYVTDSFIIESLLKKEYFNKRILEPACGTGAISEVLKKHNYFVFSSDKYDHNYGTIYDVVTNPPYKIYVFVKRQNCYKNGIEEKQSSIITYAWFIWKKGYKGYSFIDWIN